MNVKRFTARNSREALRLVREALGDDAVVLSTKPGADRRRGAWRWRRKASSRLKAMAAEHEPASRRPPNAAAARAAELDARRAPTQDAERLVDEHAVVPGLRPRSAC